MSFIDTIRHGAENVADFVQHQPAVQLAEHAIESATPLGSVAGGLSMAETLASRTGIMAFGGGGYGYSSGSYNKYQPGGASPAEWWFAVRHPFAAQDFKANADNALATAQRLFPASSLHNGDGDAFRHAYWNALMTRGHGADLAKEFADAHESNPNNPADEKAMDLHNNEVGRQIALEHPNATDEELAGYVMQALRDGRLTTLK